MSTGTATTVAPPAAAASAASAQGQPVAVVDAARIAIAAARAVLLEAIVQGRAPDGVVTLKTQQGNVQIRSTTPLPSGATVALELTRNGDQLSARLFPAAALRPPPTAAATTTPLQTATPGGNQAAATTTTASTTPSPAVRPETVGGATFGAVALASDPPMPTRTSTGNTASPQPANSVNTPSPSAKPVASNAGSPSTTPIATRGAVLSAPPPQAASPATDAAPPRTQATVTATPNGATPTGASPSTPMAPRLAITPGQTTPTPTAPAPGSATPSPSSPTTITADAPMATRAAAAALYAQARPAAATRAAPSTASMSAATPGTRPEAELPTGARAPTSGNAGAPAPAPTAPQAAARLQPGTTLEVRIAQTAPQPAGPGTRPAQPLPATVVGAMPQGRLIVDTPVGRLAVSVPPDLLGTPAGETLSLEWLPETTRKPLSGDGTSQNAPSARGWPQAREAATALLARAEPTAREAADQLVPKPGPRLAQQMMGFVGRGDGDVARWLGEAVMRQLEQLGMTDLVARADGGATREPDRQPGNGDWRHVTMPLFDGTQLRPIEIRARRRNGGQAEGARDQSRFVVDCVHDELGAVQIDGLMTSAQAKKRLDVILRSHVALPEVDRIALGTLFADTCGAMGLGGEIAFQVLEHFPVVADNPLAHRAVIA